MFIHLANKHAQTSYDKNFLTFILTLKYELPFPFVWSESCQKTKSNYCFASQAPPITPASFPSVAMRNSAPAPTRSSA